jgi:hypothetical protein
VSNNPHRPGRRTKEWQSRTAQDQFMDSFHLVVALGAVVAGCA